jgi:hypothetical protein
MIIVSSSRRRRQLAIHASPASLKVVVAAKCTRVLQPLRMARPIV